ncbi:hypothetical protein AWV72_01525 [Lactiplantibacillus plantarum]|uniref:hypothetical protein n=2 Tax=Lactiplantibacillus plantarum TaxID=1590 RepID=UPI00083FAC3B|nr:hypothetical protein [Lactiplantibacillus plantarum]AOG32301.1 hypothetical protein AWV72_01525 [Lactiplantibacillus plantarum]MCS6092525.1 hypothetical protein [Lactobacillus sp. LMY-20]MDR7678080.1 hypothetical protein [Lactiplantibacillus plantarum]
MSFERSEKRYGSYLMIIIFFMCTWFIKGLQLLINADTLGMYLLETNKSAFNYFDNLTFAFMYLPLYLLFEYMLWHENSQIVVRFGSRVRYLRAQTTGLIRSTLLFWLVFAFFGVLPLISLPGSGWETFIYLFVVQTLAYFLISLEFGIVLFWFFQLLPKLHLVLFLSLAVLPIIYYGVPIRPMNLFQKVDLLKRYYYMQDLTALPMSALITLVAVPIMTLCLRVLWIQHEEFWQ